MEKPPMLRTALTELLKIDYPVIAAPMFLISDAGLTTAVCRAGATAAMPALNFRPVEALRTEIRKIKAATSAPFGVNIIVQDSNKLRDQQVDICLEEKVAYLITSLGNPTAIVKKAHQAGAKVFCDVVSVKHAKKVVDAGADALIAVSAGAGGHAGTLSPFALVPTLKAEFKVPVIAAGAIGDGKTMLAAFALGADGVYCGTRFIACSEATVPGEYKQAILSAAADDIVFTDRVDGFPGNFIRTADFDKYVPPGNAFEKMLRISPKLDKYWRLLRASKTLLGEPAKLKASYKTVFSAGHGVDRIDTIETAEAILQSMVAQYWTAKKALP
jgi:nitronate monooxygenase